MSELSSALSFEHRRRIETLAAIWPVSSTLGLARPAVYALAERVASLPLDFLPRWAAVESWPRLECEGLDKLDAATAGGRGVIVVPAHFGAYHWTMIALLHAGLSVSLLVDTRNRDFFSADVRERMLPMYYERGLFHERGFGVFDAIDSESPTSLWQLNKAVKAGRAAILFVDGNSGIDGRLDPKGAVRASLLGREVWVRPGIAVLAQTAKVSIVPVTTTFDRERNVARFVFEDPIEPLADESRTAGRERIMAELFAWLERQIRARPDAWEEWWLLPNWWIEAPTSEPPRAPTPSSLELPSLVGRRLQVADSCLWRIDLPDGPAVFDLARGQARTQTPALVDLFEHAERGTKVLAWMREQDDASEAKQLLARALAMRLVVL